MTLTSIAENYPVAPSHINTSRHLWNAFDKMETEISALWLVRLAQERGDWSSFTDQEIAAFYQRKHRGAFFHFNGAQDYLILDGTGRFHFTHQFVARCFLASPQIEQSLPIAVTSKQ